MKCITSNKVRFLCARNEPTVPPADRLPRDIVLNG